MGRIVRPSDAVITGEDTETKGTWLWQDVDPVADSILAAKEKNKEHTFKSSHTGAATIEVMHG
jgi:hypothetical protein